MYALRPELSEDLWMARVEESINTSSEYVNRYLAPINYTPSHPKKKRIHTPQVPSE